MSFGSQSIRFEPMPGAGTFRTVPSVRPIGPFPGSAGVHRADIQGMVTVSAFSSEAARLPIVRSKLQMSVVGSFRTSRDVRHESGIRSNADARSLQRREHSGKQLIQSRRYAWSLTCPSICVTSEKRSLSSRAPRYCVSECKTAQTWFPLSLMENHIFT